MNILAAVLTLGGLGVIFGLGLAWVAKKFLVITDLRLEEIINHLPGANCGACGMPGCRGFAEGLIKGKIALENCPVSQEENRQAIAKILGIEIEPRLKTKAVLHCQGGKKIKDKFIYMGIKDCLAANLIMQGPKACVYGCIGYGTCAKVCPFGAIIMNEENLPRVEENKCTGCGKCVAICPKGLFSLVSVDKTYVVGCKSLDLGKEVMQVCSVGCIGCRKCEKVCPTGAIKVIDNLAVIDYSLCNNCGECFKVCPTGTILRYVVT